LLVINDYKPVHSKTEPALQLTNRQWPFDNARQEVKKWDAADANYLKNYHIIVA
jgi:hypothetical protein